VPDLNVIPRLPSVSGYASIVNGNYESVTHTHEQDDLDIGQLASGTLDQLDLREIVTVPEYFLVPLAAIPRTFDDVTQVSENISSDPILPRGFGADYNQTSYPFYPGPRATLGAGKTTSWYYGESLDADAATVLLQRPAGPGVSLRVGTLSADGATRWGSVVQLPVGATRVSLVLPPTAAVGLSLQAIGASVPPQRVVITAGGHPYELGGSLSSALVPGPWQVAGFAQGYAVFTLRRPPVAVSATTMGGRHVPVTVASNTTKSEQIRVLAPGHTTVLRSVAWDAGWKATVSVDGGTEKSIPVKAAHLVQEVQIPAGRDVVTFHYRPPHLLAATVLSLGGVALLLVLLGGWLVRRRGRPTERDEEAAAAQEPLSRLPASVG
jgi:hypothetical protein